MSDEDLVDGVAVDEGEIANGAEETRFFSIAAALEAARDKLLDRSLRNKLISTPLTSSRARHVRIFDELSDKVWRILLTGRAMTFAPAPSKADAENEADEAAGLWVPPKDDDQDDQGFASRHRDNRLQTHLTPEGLQKRLLSLYYEGQTLEEEQGVNVLFLALGFLEWREAKQSDTPRFAPLVLLPVELVRDGARDRFKLTLRQDDLITNVSLQAWLKEQFGILLPDLPEADEWTPSSYFAAVQAAIGSRHGWRVLENEILLGFFSFAKFLLWRDLDPENWPTPDKLTSNPLLKQILLRDDEELVDTPVLGDDERVDEVFPLTELVHITDADSSQAIAIQEAMAGKNLVIQGPPGTGKSQTITNIIAGAVQRGKSVLFVAEKMAALEVVHQRLVDRKLAAICLELHSRKSSKTQVLEQLKQARNAAAPPRLAQHRVQYPGRDTDEAAPARRSPPHAARWHAVGVRPHGADEPAEGARRPGAIVRSSGSCGMVAGPPRAGQATRCATWRPLGHCGSTGFTSVAGRRDGRSGHTGTGASPPNCGTRARGC